MRREDNPTVRGCSELVVGFGLALLACLVISLCSCKPTKEIQVERVEVPVPIVQEHTIESVRVDHVRDTLIQRDSVFHYVKGDTVLINAKIQNYNGTCEPVQGYVEESTNPNF